MPVTHHQDIGASSQCRSQYPTIGRIGARQDARLCGSRDDLFRAQVTLDLSDDPWRDPESLCKHATQFLQIDLSGKELVLAQYQSHQVRTETPGGVRTDQDNRVEENPHETSRNTSSSVR